MKVRFNRGYILKKIFGYIIALVLILQCRSMWIYSEYRGLLGYMLLILLFFSSVGYSLLCGVSKKACHWVSLFTGTLFLYAALFLIVNTSNIKSFLLLIVAVWILCCLIKVVNVESLLQILIYYENIIYLVCIISLIFWIFGSYLGVIHSTGNVISYWTGQAGVSRTVKSYYGIYFEPQKINFLQVLIIVRNCAFFTEAPMCSLHFCLAFMIQLFVDPKKNNLRFLILLAGILSTFSTLGYICVVIAITTKYLLSKPRMVLMKLLKTLIVPILLIGSILIIIFFVIDKISYGTSGSTRLDDFRAGFLAWLDSPLFGNGFGNTDSYIKYMNSSMRLSNNNGFSNSFMQILAYGGIYLALPYLINIVCTFHHLIKKRSRDLLLFFALFCCLFFFTLVPFQYLSIFLMLSFTKLSKY